MPDYTSRYEQTRLAAVRRLLPPGPGRAVDVGCHQGVTTALVAAAGWTVTGFDPDPEVVAAGRRHHPRLDLRVGDVTDATRTVGPVDLVTCLEVLEHVPRADHDRFVAGLAGLLTPTGTLLLSTPPRWSLISVGERCAGLPARRWTAYRWWDDTHVAVRSAGAVLRLLTRHGFTVTTYHGVHYLPRRLRADPVVIRRGPARRVGFDLIVSAGRRG